MSAPGPPAADAKYCTTDSPAPNRPLAPRPRLRRAYRRKRPIAFAYLECSLQMIGDQERDRGGMRPGQIMTPTLDDVKVCIRQQPLKPFVRLPAG